MKIKQLYILSTVFILLACFIIFYERKLPDTVARKELSSYIFSFRPQQVEDICLTNRYGSVTVHKGQDGWRISPSGYRADKDVIEALIDNVAHLRFERIADISVENEFDYGFRDPRISVGIIAAGVEYRLDAGISTALGENIYIRVLDKKKTTTYIADSFLLEKLDKNMYDFYSKQLVPSFSYLIDYIHIERSISITLSQQEDHNWHITEPVERMADQDRIHGIISAFQNIEIVDFVDDASEPDLLKYGLAAPALTVTIGSRKQQLVSISVGDLYHNKSRYYVKNSIEPFVYGIPKDDIALFFSTLPELSSDRFFFLDVQDIARIELRTPDELLSVERRNGKWMINDRNILADSVKIDEIISFMKNIKVRGYLSDEELKNRMKFGLPEQVQLKFTTLKDNESDICIFYRDNDGSVVAGYNGTLYNVVLPDDEYSLPLRVIDIAEKNLLDFNRYTLQAVSYRDSERAVTVSLKNQNWFVGDSPLEQSKVEQMLNTLQLLEPVGVYAVETVALDESCGFDNPTAVLVMSFSEGSGRTVSVEFGTIRDGVIFGRNPAYPVILLFDTGDIIGLKKVFSLL